MSWQLKRCSLSQALNKIILLLEFCSPLLIFPLSEAESGAEGYAGLGCFWPGLGTWCSARAAEGGALDSFSSWGTWQWWVLRTDLVLGHVLSQGNLMKLCDVSKDANHAMDGSGWKAGQCCLWLNCCVRCLHTLVVYTYVHKYSHTCTVMGLPQLAQFRGCLGIWVSSLPEVSQGAQPGQRVKKEKDLNVIEHQLRLLGNGGVSKGEKSNWSSPNNAKLA